MTDLDFLSLRARPLLTRKSAMLTNCPVSLEQVSVTGTGHRSTASFCNRRGRDTMIGGHNSHDTTGQEISIKRESCHLGLACIKRCKRMEVYKEMRNLDGNDSQRSGQIIGDQITSCSCPGGLTSCRPVKKQEINLDPFCIGVLSHVYSPQDRVGDLTAQG